MDYMIGIHITVIISVLLLIRLAFPRKFGNVPRFSVGAEYNYIMNSSYTKDEDQSGYSVFASVNLPKNISLYARYDDIYSRNDWNIAKDEASAILGAEFKLGKYVKLSPNFRMAVPKADGVANQYSAYLNCYFGF